MNLKEAEVLKNQYLTEMSSLMNFTEEEFEVINSLNMFRTFKKGTVLLKAGQFSQISYYVIKGCLRSYYLIKGEEKVTEFYLEDEQFISSCITTNKVSDHYLTCEEDCLVSIGTLESEKIMLEKFPRFEKLCRIKSEELLSKQKKEFENFKIASPEQRYINLTLSRPNLIQRVPQYQIASYLGLTPQSISRIRKRLTKHEIYNHKIAI